MKLTKDDERKLKRLLDKPLTVKAIAGQIGVNAQALRYILRKRGVDVLARAQRLGLIGSGNAKHKHLRRPVLTYFRNHSALECQKKFGLTPSEFKSLCTAAYRDPSLADLRKDFRRNDRWTFEETMFLLRHAGIRNREWIASKLKRGTMQSVKEQVSRLSTNTRYINGLSYAKACQLLRDDNLKGIKTKAGPQSASTDFRYVLVPWVVLNQKAKRKPHIPDHLKAAIAAMAKFQMRIHGTRSAKATIESIKRCLRRR